MNFLTLQKNNSSVIYLTMQGERQQSATPTTIRSLKNILNNNRVPLGKYIQHKNKPSDKNLTYFERLKSMIGNPESQYKNPLGGSYLASKLNTINHQQSMQIKTETHCRSKSILGSSRSNIKKTALEPSSNLMGTKRKLHEKVLENIKTDIFQRNQGVRNQTMSNLNRRKGYKTEVVNYKSYKEIGNQMTEEKKEFTLGRIELKEVLGTGANAKVRLGLSQGMTYAVKIYQKYKLLEPKKKKRVYSEIDTLKKIPEHPNVIQLYQSFEDKRQIHMIFQHLEGALTLQQYFRNNLLYLEPKEIKRVFIRVAKSVTHIHQSGVAHRDIKPDNVLIGFDQDGEIIVKIIDFGFATGQMFCQNHCGTPNFMAPQLVDGAKKYNPFISDMWALGVLLFYLCEGRYPFKGYDEKDLFRSIKKGSYEIKKTTSPMVISMIENMLAVDPKERITAAQLTQDAWFFSDLE